MTTIEPILNIMGLTVSKGIENTGEVPKHMRVQDPPLWRAWPLLIYRFSKKLYIDERLGD